VRLTSFRLIPMPWCQFLIDEPGDDERTFKRLLPAMPATGDVIEFDQERVVVTRVSPIPMRSIVVGPPTAIVFCQPATA
jgi:hypothetical protein